ncbi:MAG: methionyl-tRNA formyltransferase [Chloroflexi bacterium]|nr:methionyl-tRNA formyltransferase [Chloroflexota bacterium]
MSARVVFMGSPQFAVPSLFALNRQFALVGVVTQPDRSAGRGRALTPPPVKEAALALGLPVFQPDRLRGEALEPLRAWRPDLIVVAAFGQILGQPVLDLPRHGCINVHASLLPRWRGAAPINAAIFHGDPVTGVTIMKMDKGIDTGPILAQEPETILPEDTAQTLSARLAERGARLLVGTLPGYIAGDIKPQPQSEADATYAPMLKKEDGMLDCSRPANELTRQVRAYQPWPGAFIQIGAVSLKILSASSMGRASRPGERLVVDGWPALGTGDGILILREVQPPGKRPMDGKAFLLGARDWLRP